ncbi:CocE/NonD family hydrolase [Actinokineospora sp. G85]|uniref:CocE/NonD family hydrolase n=1 Tax=Actinokineospora sp. G85 TaxID=3406626 RepID=UPI003C782BE9
MTEPRDLALAGLAHTLVDGDGPLVLIRTPYGRHRHLAEARGWAKRGFSCVVGDVRGRYGSGGVFEPYRHEADDGAAVLDELARLGHDRVVCVGASYAAHCAVTSAIARPDQVVGVVAAVPALGLGETAREPGGAARLACRVGWWSENVRPARHTDLARLPVVDAIAGWEGLWGAPERTAAVWDHVGGSRMPLLAVGGVRDPFAADTERLAGAWGGPTRLVLGPWGHELDADEPGAALAGRRIGALYTAWARACADLAGDKAFVAVDGWRRLGAARSEVSLSVDRARFTADPEEPWRSVPLGTAVDDGPCAVLSADLPAGELRGSIEVVLTVVADCPDADWVVRLVHGGVHHAHAVRRVRHEPGVPREVRVELPPVGLAVSGPVRLQVGGHHWPRHARNPHTGEDPVRATRLLPSARVVLAATASFPHHPAGADAVPDLIQEVAS